MEKWRQTDLDRLLSMARIKLTGSSLAGLKAELYDVLRIFFKDSSSWTSTVPFVTVDQQTAYDLNDNFDTPRGQIEKFVGVFDDKNVYVPAAMPVPGKVELRDPPVADKTLSAIFLMNVTLPVDHHTMVPEFPSFTLDLYSDGILAGLCWRMMSQQNKSYTDDKNATLQYREFRNTVTSARAAALHANTYNRNAWAFPQGFRTRGQRGGVSVGNVKTF